MVYFNLKDASTGAGLWGIVMGIGHYDDVSPNHSTQGMGILTILVPSVILTVMTRNKYFLRFFTSNSHCWNNGVRCIHFFLN